MREVVDSYDLIRHLRKAQYDWFHKNGLEGALWRVNLEVLEMSNSFEEVLKRIVDEDNR